MAIWNKKFIRRLRVYTMCIYTVYTLMDANWYQWHLARLMFCVRNILHKMDIIHLFEDAVRKSREGKTALLYTLSDKQRKMARGEREREKSMSVFGI